VRQSDEEKLEPLNRQRLRYRVAAWLADGFGHRSCRAATTSVPGRCEGRARSVAGSILLILEMDQPFEGLMRISSAPWQHALALLGQ
jgi:hypothetical protein